MFDPACEVFESGDCVAAVCAEGVSVSPAADGNAGTIDASLTSGSGAIQASISPESDGSYLASEFSPVGNLLGAETGTVSASGGTIDSFSMEVQVPLLLVNTVAIEGGDTITAQASEALALTWDRGTPGTYYSLQQRFVPEGSGEQVSVRCSFDSQPGAGTIAADVMNVLPPGTILSTYTVAHHDLLVDGALVRTRTIVPTTTEAKNAAVEIVIE
jgi:hypothetical protein